PPFACGRCTAVTGTSGQVSVASGARHTVAARGTDVTPRTRWVSARVFGHPDEAGLQTGVVADVRHRYRLQAVGNPDGVVLAGERCEVARGGTRDHPAASRLTRGASGGAANIAWAAEPRCLGCGPAGCSAAGGIRLADDRLGLGLGHRLLSEVLRVGGQGSFGLRLSQWGFGCTCLDGRNGDPRCGARF